MAVEKKLAEHPPPPIDEDNHGGSGGGMGGSGGSDGDSQSLHDIGQSEAMQRLLGMRISIWPTSLRTPEPVRSKTYRPSFENG